jgi:hypothetical protein
MIFWIAGSWPCASWIFDLRTATVSSGSASIWMDEMRGRDGEDEEN